MPRILFEFILEGENIMKRFLINLFNGELTKTGRIIFVIAAFTMLISLFLPWWHLNLIAPQYPEGLPMTIYSYKIDGRIDIINNINHYIGMRWISEDDFAELKIIPVAVGFIIVLALISAAIKKAWLAWITVGLGGIGGLVGLYDLWYWLRKYGTDLDPMAAIKIDPFIPPIIGTNKLANFVTYTGFNSGGYLLGLGVIMMLIAAWRFREYDKGEE